MSDAKQTITIFAAASTIDAVEELAQRFEADYHTEVNINAAATSVLALQIINGATADIFISANVAWADGIEQGGFVAERSHLLGNRLVFIMAASNETDDGRVQSGTDSPKGIDWLADSRFQRIAVADTESVPAGIYAKRALQHAQLWNGIEPRLVRAQDVRAALTWVKRGEADAGIVYATDALSSDGVHVVATLDEASTGPIRYPVMLLKHGADREPAAAFYEFVKSSEAAEVFREHGFTVFEN